MLRMHKIDIVRYKLKSLPAATCIKLPSKVPHITESTRGMKLWRFSGATRFNLIDILHFPASYILGLTSSIYKPTSPAYTSLSSITLTSISLPPPSLLFMSETRRPIQNQHNNHKAPMKSQYTSTRSYHPRNPM